MLIVSPIGSMYGVSINISPKNQPNAGMYTSPMDPMGLILKTHFPYKVGPYHLKNGVKTPISRVK